MHLLFSSNHVQLLNACYPPSSALLTSGPDYNPKSQELSRLTYYALNHPGKLTKLGSELEKRLKLECRKAKAGNMKMRASLLITLAILRSLAVECRRDISLLSPSLVSSVDITLSTLPFDLEVIARAASVFSAWTTYTDGHLIGADAQLTKDYIEILHRFSSLSSVEMKDHELRNRTRLVGFAALTSALNSEALYNDSLQFRTQVAAIMRPILRTLLQTDTSLLDEQSSCVKDVPMSPYLAEFRRRPAIERRAASIHVHVDGDKGPANSEVSSACLHALYSLLEHANGSQLAHIMRSSLDSLDELDGWLQVDHCCWFAQKAAEWASYQYRYAMPTCLVERLLERQDIPTIPSHCTLAVMLKTIFTSPTPFINLSTSDINSNLISILLRRARIDPQDHLLPALVDCIASLGCHIYYSDQIQDLAAEIINRISFIENRSNFDQGSAISEESRSQAIRCLLAGLLGLIQAAEDHEKHEDTKRRLGATPAKPPESISSTNPDGTQLDGFNRRSLRRTRVPPDIWQDTLTLLSSQDFSVRADYAQALIYYLSSEMPKLGDGTDSDGVKRGRRLNEGPILHAVNLTSLLNSSDPGVKFLNAIHALLYTILANTAPETAPPVDSERARDGDDPQVRVLPSTPSDQDQENGTTDSPGSHNQSSNGRRSMASSKQPRVRKFSLVLRLLQHDPPKIGMSLSDYSLILLVLVVVHEELPARALITGVPMLLALDERVRAQNTHQIVRVLISKVWLTIARVWDCPELNEIAERALSSVPPALDVPVVSPSPVAGYHPPPEPTGFPTLEDKGTQQACPNVDGEAALLALAANKNVQEASGLDEHSLLRRLSHKWTPDAALNNSPEHSAFESVRGDAISPLLRISPAMMHIENVSLQSLARSTRGVGVTDLREALEGRSSISNPALVRPSSISTLDHTSSIAGESRHYAPARPRSRSAPKKRAIPSKPGEVKDVLNRLGIGKQNGSLLKSSFPALPKPDQRVNPRQE